MIAYPAHFEQETDPEHSHLWGVVIPGLNGTPDGAVTCGDSLQEARLMAKELVETWLILHWEAGRDFPLPGKLPGLPGWELVRPSMRVYWALTVRTLREKAGLTQAEAATRMGVSQSTYARLEDVDKSNPTLETVERLAQTFGVAVSLATEAA